MNASPVAVGVGAAIALGYGWLAWRSIAALMPGPLAQSRSLAARLALRQGLLVVFLWGSWHFLGMPWGPLLGGFLAMWTLERIWLSRRLTLPVDPNR
jgi:hypothetical protein